MRITVERERYALTGHRITAVLHKLIQYSSGRSNKTGNPAFIDSVFIMHRNHREEVRGDGLNKQSEGLTTECRVHFQEMPKDALE